MRSFPPGHQGPAADVLMGLLTFRLDTRYSKSQKRDLNQEPSGAQLHAGTPELHTHAATVFKMSVFVSPFSRVQRSLRVLQGLLRREDFPHVLLGTAAVSPARSPPALPPPLPQLKCAISHFSVKQAVGRRTCDPPWHLSSFPSPTCDRH